MRRLVLVVVLLLGLLAVADRMAALGAERIVAKRLQAAESLAVRPDVSIGGVPFLTQMARGRYDDVTVTVHDLRRGDLHIAMVRAHLTGVRVPFADVLRQHVGRVRVATATAEILLTFADVNSLLAPKGVHLSAASGGQVHASGTRSGSVGGVSSGATFSADVPLDISGDSVIVRLPDGQTAEIPLPQMPFGIALLSARGTSEGITVVCSAHGLELVR